VNDDPRAFKMIASLLGAAYEVSSVSSGDEAVAILEDRAEDFCCSEADIVILDASTPGRSGFDLCRRLRENPATAEIPVAIVTSVDSLHEKVRAIEAGADDLIGSPIDQIELRARVRSLMRVSRLRRQLERARRDRDEGSTAPGGTAAFARVVVHDLRGPLSGILGNAQLLDAKAGVVDPDLARLAGRILTSALQMQARLSDVLDICLFESRQRPLQLERTNVRAAAAIVLDEYRDIAGTCEVSLELEPAEEDPERPAAEARVDAKVLLRVIDNLVATGLRHTPPGGTVRIVVGGQSAGKVEIHVADTGDVLSREIHDAVFGSDRRDSKETGPGSPFDRTVALRYCRLAVEAHGGRLWLEQNAAGGNTFGFLLPEDGGQAGA